jgi:hypothetical protein
VKRNVKEGLITGGLLTYFPLTYGLTWANTSATTLPHGAEALRWWLIVYIALPFVMIGCAYIAHSIYREVDERLRMRELRQHQHDADTEWRGWFYE